MVDCVSAMHIPDAISNEPPNMKRVLTAAEQRSVKKLRYSSSDSAISNISEENTPLSENTDCLRSPLIDTPNSATLGALSTPMFSADHRVGERNGEYGSVEQEQGEEEEEEGGMATFADSFATGDSGAEGWTEKTLVRVLTNDIEDLCMANDTSINGPEVRDDLKIFFSQYKQPFEMDFYVSRLVQYSNCSASAFVAALVYLDRVHLNCRSLSMTEMNCHRLLSTALVLAVKYLDDEVYANAYYARVSGLTLDELNTLEAKMLEILDWRLTISPDEYHRYEDSLHKAAAILHSDPSSPVPSSDVSLSSA